MARACPLSSDESTTEGGLKAQCETMRRRLPSQYSPPHGGSEEPHISRCLHPSAVYRSCILALPLVLAVDSVSMTSRFSMKHKTPASETTTQTTAPDPSPELMQSETTKDFPSKLSDGQAQAFRHLAHSIVSRTLALESEYQRVNCVVNWKLVKQQDDFSIYKCRTTQQADQAKLHVPTIFCVGSMPGSLEDVLYGAHAKTRDEMMLKLPHQSRGNVDCAVVSELEGGSSADPYRHLSLKWRLTKALGDVQFMSPRDLCTLESMGINVDAHGDRYGYYLIKSVNYAGCPPPHKHSGTIRANIMFSCIYRQVPGSQTVDVYAKGIFDLGGDSDSSVVIDSSCSVMLSMLKSVESAEIKRLTLLTVRKAFESSTTSSYDEVDQESVLSDESTQKQLSGSALSVLGESNSSKLALPPGFARLLAKAKRKSRTQRLQEAETCCVCSKKPAKFSLMGNTQRTCGVCLRGVCNKCVVKRRVLTQQQPVLITCCKACLLAAKQLVVDPQDPCPVIV